MTTRATLLAALCALVVAPGCGDDDGPPSSQQKPAGDTSVAITAPDETAPAAGPATTLAYALVTLGAILKEVRRRVLDGELTTREAELAAARRLLALVRP